MLAMPVLSAVSGLALVLEDDDLLALAVGFDLGDNFGALNVRAAQLDIAIL